MLLFGNAGISDCGMPDCSGITMRDGPLDRRLRRPATENKK